MQLKAYSETFSLAGVFAISRGARTKADVVTVSISDGNITGYGECYPYKRYGESARAESSPAGKCFISNR